MRPRRPSRRRGESARRPLGQAMVEFAIILPALVILLAGAAQVGSITYAQVSVDTAAREGARAGVEAPNTSLESWDPSGTSPATHQCTAAEFVYATNNPICFAVANSSGFLNQSTFTSNPCGASQGCVTIKLLGSTNLAALLRHAPKVRLLAAPGGLPQAGTSSCNGSQATITGTISGMPGGSTATVTDTSGDTTVSSTSGSYTLCASGGSQTITATVTGICGGYTGSVGPISVTKKNSYTENITVTDGFAQVSGSVSGIPAGQDATVTDSTGDSVGTVSSSYTLCVVATSTTTTQTLTAQVGSTTCGGYQGSVGSFGVTGGSSYTENFGVTAESACTTTTSTTTTSSSSTTTTTTSTSTSSGIDCPWEAFGSEDDDYISVTVTYPSPVFVPFIGGLFGSSGVRMVTTNVTYAIEPCSLTVGH